MEKEAQDLLTTLKRSSVQVDAKVQAFNNLKSSIKHQRLPDATAPIIFECIRIAITSTQSPSLSNIAFSTLGHLIKRLSLQNQNGIIIGQAKKLLPVLLERLGDQREAFRNAASGNLGDFYPFCQEQVEALVKDTALSGHSPRAKEAAMMWVLKMHKTENMPFKSYVPQLVNCLEDADGMVRETAKSTIVELFRNAPDHAKTDLKKRMKMQDVRTTIVSHVTSQLDMRPTDHLDRDMGASTMSVQTMPDLSRNESAFGASTMSEHPPQQEEVSVEPTYVSTQRELEDIFRDMQTLFEGKETEHNWVARDKSVTKLRRLLKGNAEQDFHAAFVAGIRSVIDGVSRISNSLRTTVSSNACQLAQELAKALGPALDPNIELLIQNYIKMSANTKQIAANNGSTTVNVLLSHVSYNKRLMEHIWFSLQEKNVQTRTFATSWLRTLITKHASHKHQIEHTGGVDLAEKCIKKGLGDANPKVREGIRAAYWSFSLIWGKEAEKIIDSLDAKARQQLERDPNNPNGGSTASSTASVAGLSKSTTSRPAATSRPSVKDAIAAQRRAAMAARNNLPERPGSAAAILSPAKPAPSTTTASSSRTAAVRGGAAGGRPPSALSREVSSSTTTSQASTGGSLMAAPVRRPRRPEMARPATADPYAASRRNGARVQTPNNLSPNASPQKSKSTVKAPARTPGRAMAATAASSVRAKSRTGMTENSMPVRRQPRRSTTGAVESPLSSPSRGDASEMSIVVPFTKPPDSEETFAAPTAHARRYFHPEPEPQDDAMEDTEGFTMVVPKGFDTRPTSSHSRAESATKIPTPKASPKKSLGGGAGVGAGSPLNIARMRSSPMLNARSPERVRNSPMPSNLSTVDGDRTPVQVYEDPFTTQGAQANGASEYGERAHVLEELPIERANERQPSEESATMLGESTRSNEQNATPRRGHIKTTSTGSVIAMNGDSNSAEAMRSRRLLVSGIERIKARTLDAHGFRKLQDIVKSDLDVWGAEDEKFGDLLLCLLDYFVAPNDTLKVVGSGTGSSATKVQSLKGQVLATIRAMLSLHRGLASQYYSRALCAVLVGRRQWDESVHITAEIEKTAAEVVRSCNIPETIGAVVDLLDQSPRPASSDGGAMAGEDHQGRTTAFGLAVLGSLLREASKRQLPLSGQVYQRLGSTAVKFLGDPDSDVRKADLDFCLVLNERLGGNGAEDGKGEEFWRLLRGVGVKEGSVNLITYYIAKSRRGRA